MSNHHDQIRLGLYRAVLRQASRTLDMYSLDPDDDLHVADITALAEETFGVTLSEAINGKIEDHQELLERLYNRLINKDQGLADSEEMSPNIHASNRHQWAGDMLRDALRTSLPKVHEEICVLLDEYTIN